MSDLLTIDGLAELLGVSRSTVMNLRKSGDGPKEVTIGARVVRFRRDDVVEWLDSHAREAEEVRGVA